MTAHGVVAGWGCVAKTDIEEGTTLFSIPQEACFRAPVADSNNFNNDDDDDDDDNSQDEDGDPTTVDSQKELALHLLRCKQSSNDDMMPFIRMLTPHPLPWTWPESFRRVLLMGTELELIVENKVKRILTEFAEIVNCKDRDGREGIVMTLRDYLDASALSAR